MTIKKLVAWLPARIVFYSGDLACKLLDGYITVAEYYEALDENQDDETIDELYQIYSFLINLSVTIDDWGHTDLWIEPNQCDSEMCESAPDTKPDS